MYPKRHFYAHLLSDISYRKPIYKIIQIVKNYKLNNLKTNKTKLWCLMLLSEEIIKLNWIMHPHICICIWFSSGKVYFVLRYIINALNMFLCVYICISRAPSFYFVLFSKKYTKSIMEIMDQVKASKFRILHISKTAEVIQCLKH